MFSHGIFFRTEAPHPLYDGNSVVTNGKIESSTLYAGNPVKKEYIFFTRESVHDFTEEDSHEIEVCRSNALLYYNHNTLSFSEIEKKLNSIKSPLEKINYIKEVNQNPSKNRFYVKSEK